MASRPIYQLHAELRGYRPKIWRRFQVLDNITMARLAYILMTMFEMEAEHLFCFESKIRASVSSIFKNQVYLYNQPAVPCVLDSYFNHPLETIRLILPDEDDELDGGLFDFNVFTTKMTEILTPVTPKTTFWYDFGDSWLIDVKLEKIFEDKELSGRELPRVIKGKGYGIIEDCGGIGGLFGLTEAFNKKEGELYEIFREWLDTDELDLTVFDIDDMNFRLKKVPRIYRDIYEYYILPTKQSLKFLTREYKKKQ